MAVYNIRDYGAEPDTGRVCTESIQRAIDACGRGDTVLIPEGTFVTGALFLKSDMTLHLRKGARLSGSRDVKDFPVMGYPYEGFDQLCYASLINTDSAPHENIAITGEGVIDAGGKQLFEAEMSDPKIKRGRAVCIRNTNHLTIQDVEIRQSPAWCLHIIYCADVLLERVRIHSKYDEKGNKYGMYNCDGIDIDSCRKVRVTDSVIASQDDCIAVKSGRDVMGRRAGIPSEDILIENCVFKSGFGVAVGSEMSGGVRDVLVRNCSFEDVHSIASVKAIRGRGSYVRNIRYEDCTLVNNSTEYGDTKYFRGALYVDGFYGAEKFDPDEPCPVDEGTPVVEDIYFKNISLKTVAGNAVYICGLPESHFKNICLENVKARGKYGMKTKNIDGLRLVNTDIRGEEDVSSDRSLN